MEIKIDKLIDEIIDIRREFHMYPELSEEEYETEERICKYLDKWDIEYERGIAKTGVVAIIRGGKEGKTIGARADIDALPIEEENDIPYKSKNPGIMHACGHDFHIAIHLGVAKILKDNEENLKGNVKIFFQPAEETIGGASRMIAEGVMENPKVENVIGLHVSPNYPLGTIEVKKGKLNASTNEFYIKVKGKGGHAAYPEKSVDSILIAAHIVTSLQSLVSRFTSPLDPVVLTIGQINGGVKNNVIAEEVTLSGTLRTLNEETRNFAKEKIEEIAKGVANSFGGEVEIDFPVPGAFAPLINSPEVVDVVVESAEEIIGKENIYFKEKPSMGGDDFSFFAQKVPSAYYFLGGGNEEYANQPAHSSKFRIDEGLIPIGIKLQVKTIYKLLEMEEVIFIE